ncbi:hypothetical protein [Paraburkholderia sp.]|nr:hypothetical protein [Paraburkholderia sp.]MDE1183365.1 hypothetical protein [Paraburkholderia sp.]
MVHAIQRTLVTNSAMSRTALGLAIVTSGFAVIVAQGVQHAFGG